METVIKTLCLRGVMIIAVLAVLGGCTEEYDAKDTSSRAIRVAADLSFSVEENSNPVTRSDFFTSPGETIGDTIPPVVEKPEVKTRAINENEVKTLWVGQYDAVSGNLLISYFLTNVGNTIQIQLIESAQSNLRFVANTDDLGKVATLNDFNLKKIAYKAESVPMFGQLDGETISVDYSKTIPLKRMLAKIELSYTIKSGFSLTLKNIYLRNVPGQIQCMEPSGQISGISYQDFTTNAPASAGKVTWYTPENKAGVISSGKDGYALNARGKKGSSISVPNATYIEIVGDATVNGTTYQNVSFRYYPGSGINDYNLNRNTPYVINLTLSGIDLSDPRVSVTVPDMVDPTILDAEINSATSMQVTSRPGTAWSLALPDWLSVLVGGSTTGAGNTLNYSGPTPVTFTAVKANPGSTVRNKVFTIDGNNVTVKQKGSILTITETSKALEAKATSDNLCSFTGTRGLSWVVSKNVNWLTLTVDGGALSGIENATGAAQKIAYSATLNTSDDARNGLVTVSAGNGLGDLIKTISVTQDGSVYEGIPATIALTSRGVDQYYLSGTEGLTWNMVVHSTNGITITPTSGTLPAQLLISVERNPSTPKRLASITVNIPDKNYSQVVSIFQYGSPPPGSEYGIQKSNISTQKTLNWDSCSSYCANLVSEDFDDWRLPGDSEMYGMWNGTSPYHGIPTSGFWGSRTNGSTAHVLYKNSSGGNVFKWAPKTSSSTCRCVRTIL